MLDGAVMDFFPTVIYLLWHILEIYFKNHNFGFTDIVLRLRLKEMNFKGENELI